MGTALEVEELRRAVAEHHGNVPDAVRAVTGLTTEEISERVALPRQTVEQCLRRAGGRRYESVRRALEAELGLSPFALDGVLDPA